MPELWDAPADEESRRLSGHRKEWNQVGEVVFALLRGWRVRGSELHGGRDGVDRRWRLEAGTRVVADAVHGEEADSHT